MLGLARRLRKAGVVGINARNRGYVTPHNPRSLYRLVDDKVLTKRLAIKAGIAVPELYGLIRSVHDARYFDKTVEGRTDFVIKPAHGSGGNGILVIARRRNQNYYKADGLAVDAASVRHHISNVLSGMYSLGGHPDQAIIEYRVHFDPIFNNLSYNGVPDIRVLVYRGVPAMAMLRLPTRQSNGRANLHQGAVGVGINMENGGTTLGVFHNRRIAEHPDFDTHLSGWTIPDWDYLLQLAARCYELAPLGYLGCKPRAAGTGTECASRFKYPDRQWGGVETSPQRHRYHHPSTAKRTGTRATRKDVEQSCTLGRGYH